MKILKIEVDDKNNKGYFINPSSIKDLTNYENEYKSIEEISKEDILGIIDYMINHDVILDEYTDGCLANPAQAIIYKNLYDNFTNLISNKDAIIKRIDDEFAEAERKYNQNNII